MTMCRAAPGPCLGAQRGAAAGCTSLQWLQGADGTAAEVKGLASGRTIGATLPGADAAALRAIPGVNGVEVRGDAVLIHSGDTDTDTVARRLLNQTPARDLEITSRGLEEAFIAMTGDGAPGPSDGSQVAT